MKFLAIAPFVYTNIIDMTDAKEVALLTCLLKLCNWIRMLLQPAMRTEDIYSAEKEWYAWHLQILELFPHDSINLKTNFHTVQHVFDFAKSWGPPILYWSRPYEHRHKTFKRLISESNHKNELVWCAEKESVQQAFRFIYPHVRIFDKQTSSNIREGSQIQYVVNGGIEYGEVQTLQEGNITVKRYKFERYHPLHKCPLWNTRSFGDTMEIRKGAYLGIFTTIASRDIEYVNHYVLLNIVKH